MKKKYIASFLSICMICTSISPTIYASETADLSAVSDVTFEEETQKNDIEENIDDIAETELENDVIADEDVYGGTNADEEIIIDGSELDVDNQISEYANEENESIISTYASDGYTKLESAPDIEYKYDANAKTLYFKCADGVKEAKMPDVTGSSGATEWLNNIDATSIKKIEIENGITYVGQSNFAVDGSGCYKNVTEVSLPESVVEIGLGAFSGIEGLSSIDLKNVVKIGQAAFQNANVKNCKMEKVAYIGPSAFEGSQIENVTLQADAVELGKAAFKNCTKLKFFTAKKITFSADATSIFWQDEVLSEFSYTEMKSIPPMAFFKAGITSFDFKNVETIGKAAFTLSSLQNICYKGTEEQWKVISASAGISKSAKVHCQADKLDAKTPTCTESGLELEDNVCEVCGEHYSTGKVLEPLGHKFADEYTVDKEATCTEEGEKSKHCTREGCNEKEDILSIPVDENNHDWKSEVTTQPTCVKDGVRTLTCSRCKDTKTEAIPATGVHQWSNWKKTEDATIFVPEQQERTCATCGKTETQTAGNKLNATATVNVSSVTLKEKQNTSSVKVTGLANGDSVKSWKSTNTKVFTVTGKADGTCKLTGVKKGSAKLEITMASGLKKTVTVKVQTKTVATSKISGLAKKMTVQKGTKATLKPVITPATSQQKVTYSSSNKKVATVSSKGVITAKKAGTAKITVKSGSKKVTVTVTVPKTKTNAITVGEKASVKKGKTYSLKAKVVPSNSDEKITYSTSNKKIATVSKSGKIKGVKKGTATITIKSGKVTKKVKVTVK